MFGICSYVLFGKQISLVSYIAISQRLRQPNDSVVQQLIHQFLMIGIRRSQEQLQTSSEVSSSIKPEHSLEPWPERALVGGERLTSVFVHVVLFVPCFPSSTSQCDKDSYVCFIAEKPSLTSISHL
jgi:hypothetical protein